MRYAIRRLRQRPVFFTAAVLTLTLGIGFNTAVFSLVNVLLLRPLPVAEPDRLVSIGERGSATVSWPNCADIRARASVFDEIAAMRVMPMNLNREDAAVRLWGYLVSGSYFPMLQIRPWRGRLIGPEDDRQTGANPVAVISHGTWLRRFGGDELLIGRTVRINGHALTVIGIAPPGFHGTERLLMSDIWVPFSMIRVVEGRDWRDSRTTENAMLLARLKTGVSPQQADAELRVISAQLASEHPAINTKMQLGTAPVGLFGAVLRGPVGGVSLGLMIAAGLMLLVACTNLAGLLLSQATDRRKELAIRVAIGGRRRDIIRMLLMEAVAISLIGCLTGALGAIWFKDVLASFIPEELPLVREFPLDWRVALFTMSATIVCVLAAGLVPAFRSSRVDAAPAMRDSGSAEGFRRLHLRDIYAAAQIAISVVLLAASGMMLRGFSEALELKPGFDPDGAVAIHYDLTTNGYTNDRAHEFGRRLLDRVRVMPGVSAAGIANSIPFSPDRSTSGIRVEGTPPVPLNSLPSSLVYEATPGYFAAMGTRLSEGRDFEDRDNADVPKVAVVNKHFVDRLLAGGPAIGRRFTHGNGGDWYQIVGVVEGGKYQTITEDPQPVVWRAASQLRPREHTLVARVQGSEAEVLRAIRRAVADLDPEVAVFDDKPLRAVMNLPLAPMRVITWVLTAMGIAAAFLSGLGVYAVVAQAVAGRTREIGIRVALGARSADVARALTGRFAAVLGISAVLGVAGAVAGTRVLATLFYARSDAASFFAAVVLVSAVGLLATIGPLRRALRVEPMTAIRQE